MPTSEKRNQIVEAAITVFAAKGYKSARVADIARNAGISEQSLYRVCHSKEEILLHIYSKFWSTIYNDIKAVRESPWEKDSIEKLKKLIHLIQTRIIQNRDLMKVIATTSLIPPEKIDNPKLKEIRVAIRKQNRSSLRLIDKIITDGQRSGEIVVEPKPAVIRQMLVGSFQTLAYGLFVQFNTNEDVGYSVAEAAAGMEFLFEAFYSRK